MDNVVLGRRGERRAMWLYLLRGYRIVARNLRIGGGEIDLVARRGRTLVVVEVKTRRSRSAGEGFEAVDRDKQRRLIRLGERLAACERQPVQVRYDVVSLFWTGWRFRVQWFRNAFQPIADARRPWVWNV